MTTHAPIKNSDRTALPRALLGRRRPSFRFKIGQTVRAADMTALVEGRSRTSKGVEMYDLRIVGKDYGRPFRTFRGDALEPVNEDPTYSFAFEIGERVILKETGETVVVTGRIQDLGSIDEYVLKFMDVDADLQVFDFQISAA